MWLCHAQASEDAARQEQERRRSEVWALTNDLNSTRAMLDGMRQQLAELEEACRQHSAQAAQMQVWCVHGRWCVLVAALAFVAKLGEIGKYLT